MLIRRIREHLRTQNWFAFGIDLLIVILGVFIGTQVSNWNAQRLAHEAGDEYRARIVRDLQNNDADLEGRAAYYRQSRDFALQVLGALDGSTRLSDERLLIAAYQASQIYPRPQNRTTYDEVIAIGALNTLGDVEARERISNYYVGVETSDATFRNVPPYRELVRRAIPYAVQQRIREACAEQLIRSDDNGLQRLVLPSECSLGLPQAAISSAARRLRATPGLELDTTRLLSDLDQKLIQTARGQDRARELADELRAN